MLTIRLQRTGKKNQADFRIVLAEKEAPVNKKFVEVLGGYNPRKKAFHVKQDRVSYWIAQNIEMSPTVHNLFVTNKLMDKAKVKAFNTPKKPAEPVVEAKPAEAVPKSTESGDESATTASVGAETPSTESVEAKSETPEVIA